MLNKIYCVLKTIKNINTFIADYLGLIKAEEVLYKTRNNLKLYARAGTSDKSEIAIVCSGSEYPGRFFSTKVKNPVIMDIGAHIGTFSNYISRYAEKTSPVLYAIEPSKSNFQFLKRNSKLNFPKSIKCFNVAIGGDNCTGYIDTTKDFDAFRVKDGKKLKNKSIEEIDECQVVTLDSFCNDQKISKIDLVKMDCEGSEYEIFGKSLDFIKKSVLTLFIEVHNLDKKRNFENFKKFLVENKFGIEAEILNRTIFVRNNNLQ